MKKLFVAIITLALSSPVLAGNAKVGKTKYSSCVACHGAAGQGGIGPKLKGISKKQIIKNLTSYSKGKTIGPQSALMIPMAKGLSKADINNLAAYITTFK